MVKIDLEYVQNLSNEELKSKALEAYTKIIEIDRQLHEFDYRRLNKPDDWRSSALKARRFNIRDLQVLRNMALSRGMPELVPAFVEAQERIEKRKSEQNNQQQSQSTLRKEKAAEQEKLLTERKRIALEQSKIQQENSAAARFVKAARIMLPKDQYLSIWNFANGKQSETPQ